MLERLELPPGAFAVVMATGIIAIAARDHGYDMIDVSLTVLAVVTFIALMLLPVGQLLIAPAYTANRARSPEVVPSAFTFVAACAVLGSRLAQHHVLVAILAAAATFAWLVLVPLVVRDFRARPLAQLREHAHGDWLLPSVATAGLAITAANLAVHHTWTGWVVLACGAWVLAILLHFAIAALILSRVIGRGLTPKEVTPDSWILMGSIAINALAGAKIITTSTTRTSFQWLLPAAHVVTLVAWILASTWIPVLLYAEMWSVDHRRGGMQFGKVWWSAVFPLGMYATTTRAVANALNLAALNTVSLVFFWDAFAVWILVTLGLIHWVATKLLQIRAHGERERAVYRVP